MRKFFVMLASIVAVTFVVSSCKETLPRRFDSFVSSVEKNYTTFSEDDWNTANDKFSKLFSEYKENRSSYNSDEKKRINNAISRYAVVVAKSGIGTVVNSFKEICSQIPSIVDEIGSVISEIGSQIPSLVDAAKSMLKELGISGTEAE